MLLVRVNHEINNIKLNNIETHVITNDFFSKKLIINTAKMITAAVVNFAKSKKDKPKIKKKG